MAGRSDPDRYDQALGYLAAIDKPLAAWVAQVASSNKAKHGKAISLAKGGFWHGGTPTQHMALRGLLLCQQVFLKPPACPVDFALDGTATKTAFKTKSEEQVKEAIRSYTRKPGVSAADFARTALTIKSAVGPFDPLTRTRADTGFGGVTNCYGAVKIWLFNSGCCSLPWYLKEGSKIDAYTVNTIIGNGAEFKESEINTIPPGWVFNIHDAADPNVCHWGVFLGNVGGKWLAAASNTTAGAPSPGGPPVMVEFEQGGNSAYGHFTFASAVAVAKLNYPSKNVVIKALDPTRGQNYY